LPPGAVVIASFGYVASSKRIEVILRALARLRGELPQLRYALVGEAVDHYELTPLVQQLGLDNIVHITGFVDSATFEAYLQMIDIGINLRTGPSGGEMSAGVVRLLAAGKPTIVSDIDGFAELPDDSVIKITQDNDEVEQLMAALRQLILDPSARAAYGENARRYAQSELSFTRVAQSYMEFIRKCLDAAHKHL
jgi:glycosyltransferase involved in cell wall biosynthesis